MNLRDLIAWLAGQTSSPEELARRTPARGRASRFVVFRGRRGMPSKHPGCHRDPLGALLNAVGRVAAS